MARRNRVSDPERHETRVHPRVYEYNAQRSKAMDEAMDDEDHGFRRGGHVRHHKRKHGGHVEGEREKRSLHKRARGGRTHEYEHEKRKHGGRTHEHEREHEKWARGGRTHEHEHEKRKHGGRTHRRESGGGVFSSAHNLSGPGPSRKAGHEDEPGAERVP
jgi:hypothetical protein